MNFFSALSISPNALVTFHSHHNLSLQIGWVSLPRKRVSDCIKLSCNMRESFICLHALGYIVFVRRRSEADTRVYFELEAAIIYFNFMSVIYLGISKACRLLLFLITLTQFECFLHLRLCMRNFPEIVG